MFRRCVAGVYFLFFRSVWQLLSEIDGCVLMEELMFSVMTLYLSYLS